MRKLPRYSLILIPLACSSIALTQVGKKEFKVPPKGQQGWKATKMTAAELGKRVDAAMKSLKNTGHRSLTLYTDASGKKGYFNGESRIQDPKTYSVQYLVLDAKPPYPGEVRADGKRMAAQGPSGWLAPRPFPAKPVTAYPPAQVVATWPATFPRVMFSNLFLGSNLWTALTTGLAQGAGGYKTVVEERKMTKNGKSFLSYRILASRPAPAAEKYGASELELVIDGKRFLPVTIRSNYVPPKAKGLTKIQWTGEWSAPNLKFAKKDFMLFKVAASR
jgi:hypothetical protein